MGAEKKAESSEVLETPELDKMSRVREESQATGEFIEWLGTKGMVIHQWTTGLTQWFPCMSLSCDNGIKRGKPCDSCGGTGGHEGEIEDRYMPISTSIEDLLAEFYGIDLKKVEQERRAILDVFRSL